MKRLITAGLMSLLMFVAGTGTAMANRSIQLEPSGAITLRGRAVRLVSATSTITADWELMGSVHRLVSKVEGSLVGTLTNGSTINCDDGVAMTTCAVAVGLRMPFHIAYISYRGTLPMITGIRVSLIFYVLIEIRLFGTRQSGCLYSVLLEADMTGLTATTLTLLPNEAILEPNGDLNRSGTCPRTGEVQGQFTIAPNQRLRLV